VKTKMRPRFYCDHCNKGSGSASAMKRHEKGCTKNPHRVCGMCALWKERGGDEPAPPRDELVRVLDAEGFDAMREAANLCPACILAAIRTKNVRDPETGSWSVAGPDDGRQSWRFDLAKKEWMEGMNEMDEMRDPR
jgi:hypothetical protein